MLQIRRSLPALFALVLAAGCAGAPPVAPAGGATGVATRKRGASPSPKAPAKPAPTATPEAAGATPAPAGTATPGLIAQGTPTPAGTATAGPTAGTATGPTATPGATGTATPLPLATATPAPALRAVIAGKLELLARISFSQGRADLVANNGAGVLANNGAGVIGNNTAGYRLAQAAPAIATVPEAGERLYVKRSWAAGGGRLRFDKNTADYFRSVDLAPGSLAPVKEHRETVTARWPSNALKTLAVADLDLAPDGALRLVRKNTQSSDEAGKVVGAVFEPNATKIRFPESGIALDINGFSLDVAAGTGAFDYAFEATGHTEVGTLSGVAPDANGRLWFSWGDPLGYYAGTSELRDAAGTLVVKKSRAIAGSTVTRGYDLGGGLVMSLVRGVNNLFRGPLKADGVEVAQVSLAIYGDGTTIYDVDFTDPAEPPMRVGWGLPDPGSFATPTPAPAWTTETVAGGADGDAVDGAGATARFRGLRGLVASRTAANRWYVAEAGNNRIRRLAYDAGAWSVTTYAGTGTAGDADGAALQAQFRAPFGLAAAADDTLYVSELEGHRIRKIAPDGTVSVLAGAGAQGFADGTGTAAKFYGPSGLALGGNALFVADQGNRRVRAVSVDTGQAITLAGDGTAGTADGPGASARFTQILGIGFADDGGLLVADRSVGMVRKIALTTSYAVTRIAGSADAALAFYDGAAGASGLSLPLAVTGDGAGGVLVGGVDLRRVKADGAIETIAGQHLAGWRDGAHGEAAFAAIYGIVRLSDGGYLLADGGRVRRLRPPGP